MQNQEKLPDAQPEMTAEEQAKHGNARTMRMGTASIPMLLLEFAIPSVVGMLVNGLYNVISAVFLGQATGEVGLAVTTAAFPTAIIFMALAMLVGNGGNALAALRLGQGRKDEAELSLGNTVTMAIILAVLVAIACSLPPCMEALLAISSTTESIHDLTKIYVWILSLGFIFQMIGMGVNNFIRTAGAPNRALLTMVVGAVACIAFNFLFVMVLGWGVPGSALATICGQAVSCASVLWYFLITPGVPIKLHRRCMKLQGDMVKEIFVLGLPSFLLQTAACVSTVAVNYQLVKYGALSPYGSDNAMAVIGVVNRVANISIMPIIGVAIAAQPLLGYNYGAGYIDRVRKTLGIALLYGCVIGTLIWLISRIWPAQIIGLFGVSEGLMEITEFALAVQLLLIPIIPVQIITSNYFQATGQPFKSIVLTLTRQVLFFLPSVFFMPVVMPALTGIDGLNGLFASWPFADICAIFTAGGFLLWELRRLGKLQRGEITDKFAGGGK